MQTTDGRELEKILASSKLAVVEAVQGLADDQAGSRQDGAWSILDVLEHLTTSEKLFARYISRATSTEQSLVNHDREAAIMGALSTRQQRLAAPKISHPKGLFTSVADSMTSFRQTAEKVVAVLASRESDLRSIWIIHPILGDISAYEAFLVIGAHRLRHVGQIMDLRSATAAHNALQSA